MIVCITVIFIAMFVVVLIKSIHDGIFDDEDDDDDDDIDYLDDYYDEDDDDALKDKNKK